MFTKTLLELSSNPATLKSKAKYIMSTDSETLKAENINSGETISCDFLNIPDYFSFFLPLAGITAVKQICESAFDIKPTSTNYPLQAFSR